MSFSQDYNEHNLPFQKKPSKTAETVEVVQTIDTEELDFSSAFIQGAKTTAKRLLFHFKAMAGGITAQILKFFVPSSIDPFYGATLICTYLGIVMLFPLRKNHLATGLGLLASLVVICAGMWPLAILIGGLVTLLLDLIEQKTDNTGFWFTIPLSLLALLYANIQMPESIIAALPIWAYGLLAIIILCGLIKPSALKHAANLSLMNAQEKKQYFKFIEQNKALKASHEKTLKEEQSYAIFARHIEVLRLMESEKESLPAHLSNIVDHIGEQSVQILKIMKADSRDVLPGGQFLNRYLPLIHQSIVRYNTIHELHSPTAIHEDIDDKTLIALQSMQQAFTQMRQQLADNDVDDLQVDLNVMDKLIRSQGFEIK